VYDYIIVGAGSAGCVLANRLSADQSKQVLVLEAGGRDTDPMIHMPGGFSKLQKPSVNWCFHTAPQIHLNNRQLWYPQGKTLGGSSSINAMIYIRGQAADYDGWAALGNDGWSYCEVLPYFVRSEHNERFANAYHGTDGPLYVSDQISPNPLSRAFIRAAQQAGHPYNADFNGASTLGVGAYQVTCHNARRWSTARAFLYPAFQRQNLTVVTKARVLRVVVEKGKAVGVEYTERSSSAIRLALCDGEVIVASGAIGSPRLLLLSGIGAADDLTALGIDVTHNLPGVGKNFQDHLNSYVVSDLKKPISYDYADAFPRNIVHGIQYVLFKTGPVTSVVAESGCFVASKEGGRPDIQMHILPAYVVNGGRTKVKGFGVTVNTVVSRPDCRGSVTLASKDPAAMPVIDPNYHSAPADRLLSVEGVRRARDILAQSELTKHIEWERFPGPGLRTNSEILDYIRQYASVDYHAVGTCKMGVDENSVVDPQLRVRGIYGLRVIDSSIMPTLISGNTNATSIMIGEKGAAILLKEAPLVADLVAVERPKTTMQLEASL
jgi:choline dehydrogenase-like flavoprotein